MGEIGHMIGQSYLSGRNLDLSAFGTDVRDWQELTLNVEDKLMTIFLNGVPIFEQRFSEDLGKVTGVDYRFPGLGDVDYLRFKTIDKVLVYEEEF